MRRRSRRRLQKVRRAEQRSGNGRKLVTIVGGLLLATGVVWGVSGAPSALSRMEVFQLRGVEVQGLVFLEPDDLIELVPLGPASSVWDDLGAWEEAMRAHPMVAEVEARRLLPDSILVVVREREPVALFPMTTLEAVDRAGQVLPIDPASKALDLPILAPELDGRPGEFLTPGQRRVLAEETGRLARVEPMFMARVSQLTLGPDRQIVARLTAPDVEVLFKAPLPARRLRQAMDALDDAVARFPEEEVQTVDLRFQEQVVVRFTKKGRG